MTREIFKDKAMYLLSGERFLGLPLFESEDIEDYRISDEQGDMPFDDFLDRLYELGVAEGWIPDIVNCSEIPTGSTTKNDIPHCQYTDDEVAQSFKEDVEAVKDQLPCGEQMDFPNTFDEFAKDYGFKDKDEVYTNGSELIPVFRVKQWLEHISTTTINGLDDFIEFGKKAFGVELTVTPQEPQTFKWCHDCKEYDQENHCCHRWSKVIRNTVEEMKEEYIEREVLDKIRAELYATAELHDDGDYYLREGWIGEIFDKYKAGTEDT